MAEKNKQTTLAVFFFTKPTRSIPTTSNEKRKQPTSKVKWEETKRIRGFKEHWMKEYPGLTDSGIGLIYFLRIFNKNKHYLLVIDINIVSRASDLCLWASDFIFNLPGGAS